MKHEIPLEDWVLMVVDNMPDKTLQDRHNFHNKMYFIAVLEKTDFGHGPHYFGPYSTPLTNALDLMVSLDFLKEVRETIPNNQINLMGQRYSFIYTLREETKPVMPEIYDTAEPMGVVDTIKEVIAKTQDVAPNIQSSACKCHYSMYYESNHNITPQLMEQIMKGWHSHDIDYKDMSKVIELLESLGLDRR